MVRVGVTAEERRAAQEVIVRLTLHLDLTAAGASDDIAHTIDYDAVCAVVAETVGGGPFHLIERIAARVADAVLGGFGVTAVDVRVEKPGALLARGVPYAAVEISRERDG